jgi:phenylacetate-coenzyme A ligase PaaK-like adenylate-forming protein
MPVNPKLVDEIESSITRDFSMSYDELKNLHSAMLKQITSTASRSPAYSSIKHITDISQLGELPMTTYAQIQELFDQLGTEKVLLTEPAIFWYTSGSTGKQKKIYYGKGDLDVIAQGLIQLLYLSGARVMDSAWVFTSTGGDTLFGLVLEKYGVKGIISTLAGEMDLINALKNASRLERIDLLVGVTWLYLVMHKVAHNPKEFEAIIEKAVRQKVKVPGLSWLVRKLLMRGINYKHLAEMLSKTRLGFSHAEALSPYLNRIREAYPAIEMHDVFGATEQWVQAIQVSIEHNWLSYFLRYSIPEIADPAEVLKAKQDPSYIAKAVPWYEWKKGMRGELIITCPNECLPLIRYPTGDIVEVMDPAYKFTVKMEMMALEITLPAIMSLGRAADSVDFDSVDQSGNFFGFKVYSRQINDALFNIKNIRWWELYHVKGSPGRFAFLVIPEGKVQDEGAFKAEILSSLTKTFVEYDAVDTGRRFILKGSKNNNSNSASHKQLIELMIARPEAYNIIDKEIKRRLQEGRAMGEQKPKRIIKVENENELKRLTAEKMSA